MQTKIFKAQFIISAPKLKDCPGEHLNEIAFIGRSNVGKSSVINAVLSRKNLAHSSSKPGKTRLINFFDLEASFDSEKRQFNFVDLPGFGYAKVAKSKSDAWSDNISEYIQKRNSLKLIVLIIDIRHKPSNKDLEAVEWLNHIKMPYIIIANKVDKLNQKEKSKQSRLLKEVYASANDFIIFSAEKRQGVDQFWQAVEPYTF